MHHEDAFDLFHGAPEVDNDDDTTLSVREQENEILLPGVVLLRNFLSLSEQQDLINTSRELGRGPGGFYRPVYASGAKCKLKMMCLGKHWNVKTEKYEMTRTNHDHASVLPLPESWRSLAERAVKAGHDVDPLIMGQCKAFHPDICVVNYYAHSGRNGLHVDKDESDTAMNLGSPVVSVSIGCNADFAYATDYPTDKTTPIPVVRLRSGDVLIFGGPNRRLVHALTRIYRSTAPSRLHLRPGRLNLTFREYCPLTRLPS